MGGVVVGVPVKVVGGVGTSVGDFVGSEGASVLVLTVGARVGETVGKPGGTQTQKKAIVVELHRTSSALVVKNRLVSDVTIWFVEVLPGLPKPTFQLLQLGAKLPLEKIPSP